MRINKSIPAFCIAIAMTWMPSRMSAQVNTASTGSDGALDFSAYANLGSNVVINMVDHSNGIYQYTYVTIPSGVNVTFIPNASNSPVTWLVQSNVVINGVVDVSGSYGNILIPSGGPGGWQGGNGAPSATGGQGLGGGSAGCPGTNGTYNYGNNFLIPLLGGSGGGGDTCGSFRGGGGGGAILIAASANLIINGSINANGGTGNGSGYSSQDTFAGDGSGGAIRLVASQITGNGSISCHGGNRSYNALGVVRFDCYENSFSGSISGNFTQGSQFIIIPSVGQLPQLTVSSIGGVPVSASPTGVLSTPDAVLSAQQNNPIPVLVNCANLPLNTPITVSVKPANGATVSATGYNNAGTLSSSTASISIVIPRGGGLIYATSATSN